MGDTHGDEVIRGGRRRDLNDVGQFDADHPEATPADWDAFFANGWTFEIDGNHDGKPEIVMSNEFIDLNDDWVRRRFGAGNVNFVVGGLAADQIADYLQMIGLAASIQQRMQAYSEPSWAETLGSSGAAEARLSSMGDLQLQWNQLSRNTTRSTAAFRDRQDRAQ